MANDSGVRPGWYTDPIGRFESRYYNGTGWTADVANGGTRFVDPLGIDPGAGPLAASVHPGPGRAGSPANGAATAAMVLGIIAVTMAWMPFLVVLGVIAAVLAITFGAVGLRRSGATSSTGRSRAIVGIVTGGSALVVAAIGIVLTVIVLDVYEAYVDPAPNEVAITSCEIVGSRAEVVGVIENLGTQTADFSVLIGFARPGTDNPRETSRAVIDDVAPGERAGFELERQVDLDEIECLVLDVTGPLPFGLALD